MLLPTTYKAVIISGTKTAVSTVSLPNYDSNSLVIKVKAAAGNPTDWKHVAYGLGPQGSIIGCDVAGEVVALGEDAAKSFKLGDSVSSFVHGSSVLHPENGAFAEYAILDSKLAVKYDSLRLAGEDVPFGKVETFEGAASVSVSLFTAGVALIHHLAVKGVPKELGKTTVNSPLLVWGGATGVGQMFIQVAKIFGSYESIIAVASKKHELYLKSLGADVVIDYHDSDCIEQIKKYANDSIAYAVDCVSNGDSGSNVNKAVSDTKPAKILGLSGISSIPPEEIKSSVALDVLLLYHATGWELPLGAHIIPASPETREAAISFKEWVGPLLARGEIKHNRIKYVPGGLEAVQGLLDDIRDGKVSGEKLVIDV
ncbi:hypothetical protein BABINDRAFT_31149 [Babjeviella inositovora NRRL Y-12698]|uniref:Enoyl reductase (ER) domain-containing protein n=1 Tax=Babjeviella inositovora NRRL Y-12698 TaxID=984486 RepID=A0A1E3QZL5_9ASCO|nr:uncharacterized protein BABINDRAFT_31149 [Babjeviella inositovora NRRL Y-12698]ODQ82522.1 hypothetical protein BABINDRAFT_31149 [Babjeviella inositovora NRRL Y-12698]